MSLEILFAQTTREAPSAPEERAVHRTNAAPCLLCLQTHSRRDGITSRSRSLGDAADVSRDPWRESGRFSFHPHLLSDLFHEGPGNGRAVLPADRNVAMIPLAGSPDIDSSPPVLLDASRQAPDRDREPRNKASAPPGACCLRCGGLLVSTYTASLERDVTGTPVTLWRCVNCGDCLDGDILANRWKSPGSTRQRARPPTGPQRTRRPRGVGTGMAR